jgi:hypothetical protein
MSDSKKWNKKQLSTLVYIETRVVDYGGRIDNRHLNRQDFDALDLLEDHGLIANNGTGIHRVYSLSDEGWKQAGLERRRRAEKA